MISSKIIPDSKKTTLKNGLRVLTENLPTMRSVAIGIMVNAGSGHEEEKVLGISHFVEHMTFKGTDKRSALKIAQDLDAVAGKINAYTSKEYTVYFAVILDEFIDIALDVLSDIFLNSLFDEKEIQLESGGILEEIKTFASQAQEAATVLTLGGQAPGGEPAAAPKEETPKEYKDRVLRDGYDAIKEAHQ